MASSYPGYDLSNDIDMQQQHDSSISSADEDVDSDDDDDAYEYAAYSDSEVVINLPLSGPQRKLYDDYLSSSQKMLDSLSLIHI